MNDVYENALMKCRFIKLSKKLLKKGFKICEF